MVYDRPSSQSVVERVSLSWKCSHDLVIRWYLWMRYFCPYAFWLVTQDHELLYYSRLAIDFSFDRCLCIVLMDKKIDRKFRNQTCWHFSNNLRFFFALAACTVSKHNKSFIYFWWFYVQESVVTTIWVIKNENHLNSLC